MGDFSKVKLGKKLGVVDDPRTFKLKTYLPSRLPKPPARNSTGAKEPIRMYANDRYGDCAFACMAHRIDVHENASYQQEIQLSNEDVLWSYGDVTGFDPATGANDNGTYMIDALNYFRHTGMGKESDGSRHTIEAFAKLPNFNGKTTESVLNTWKVGAWMFGGIYVGAWMPWSALDQLNARKEWTVTAGPDAEPGTWGGHVMFFPAYSEKKVSLTAWGMRQKATWDWLAKYTDEAYVVICEDYFRKSGYNPRGYRIDKLKAALEELD